MFLVLKECHNAVRKAHAHGITSSFTNLVIVLHSGERYFWVSQPRIESEPFQIWDFKHEDEEICILLLSVTGLVTLSKWKQG